MVIGDHQLHAPEPTPGEGAQELGPEGLGLGCADRHAEHLAPALVVVERGTLTPYWSGPLGEERAGVRRGRPANLLSVVGLDPVENPLDRREVLERVAVPVVPRQLAHGFRLHLGPGSA